MGLGSNGLIGFICSALHPIHQSMKDLQTLRGLLTASRGYYPGDSFYVSQESDQWWAQPFVNLSRRLECSTTCIFRLYREKLYPQFFRPSNTTDRFKI